MRPLMLKAKSSENSRLKSAKFWRFSGPDGQGLLQKAYLYVERRRLSHFA